jgi:hypothetical protein
MFGIVRVFRRSFTIYVTESGWPMRSMAGEEWRLIHGYIASPLQRSFIRVGSMELPSRIRWLGFALNCVFYALMTAMIRQTFHWLRRRRRMARSCCPRCAYRLHAGLAVGCPECGWNRA